MFRKTLLAALCTIATQGFAAQSLESGAVVCNDVNSIRQAHAFASGTAGVMPSQCVKTRDKVSVVSSSVIGQLARIEVVANGGVQQMWTLPLYLKD